MRAQAQFRFQHFDDDLCAVQLLILRQEEGHGQHKADRLRYSDVTIPSRTPFTLPIGGRDDDGNAVTFCIEEFDLGEASPDDNDRDGNIRPLFRSFPPTTEGRRLFPQLSDILNNRVTPGEALPTLSRTIAADNHMLFLTTVRDGRGGLAFDSLRVEVDGRSGPFVVTAPNTAVSWQADSRRTIRWDVANTNRAPVNCASGQILLSTDGGHTFPHSLG